MQKLIQNYSILVFPVLIGIAEVRFFVIQSPIDWNDKDFILYILGVASTFIALSPMLRLSRAKPWHICILYGTIGLLLIYFVFFLLIMVMAVGTRGLSTLDTLDIAKRFILNIDFTFLWLWSGCLYLFLPFNMSVIVCFVINDFYAEKIGNVISCIKQPRGGS